MTDILLEWIRAGILFCLMIFLWRVGWHKFDRSQKGWKLIIGGFGLLFFGSLLDITDNYPALNSLVIVGDTEVEAFFEKLVGFLGGFVLIAVGLVLWIPSIERLNAEIDERRKAERALEAARDKLEHRVEERTRELAAKNAALRTEVESRQRAEAAARRSKERADLANRAKSEFLANMSHELRTPLNAIIGFSETIQRQTFGPVGSAKYLEYVGDINTAGNHLLKVINDILDLSKIEAGKVELREAPIDVAAAVDACVLLVKERAFTGEIRLKRNLPAALPPLLADERMVKQILINLLSNAIKFTAAGGEVDIRVWSRPDTGYVFQVADTGMGIALRDIPSVLTPFKQLDGDLNRLFEGTGLGLPLAKSLTELHGGSLDLQSEVGVGTTVTIRLPAERIAAVAATGA